MPDLIPVLTAEGVIKAMRELRMNQRVNFWAFYSSQLGGIVTDPALMLIAFDDHMVHRGHAVFDTAGLVDSKIYDLEAHLDRFIASAARAKLALPGTRDQMRKIIMETTIVAGHSDGAACSIPSSGTAKA
jgi:4-amino-4-deoxychorismate lyase